MAKKLAPSKAKKAVVSTPVRNSAVPKVKSASVSRKSVEITSDMIAVRAYEIYISGKGGSEHDNWFSAERELRSGV